MREDIRDFYSSVVAETVTAVATDLDVALDLGVLAARSATSPFHFHRIFRGIVGETPLALSRRLRMERAAHWLVTTDKPISAIAFDSGYETHESFTRAFRDSYATSPSAFRRRGVPRIELAAHCGVHYRPGGHTPFTPIDRGHSTMHVDIIELPARRLAAVEHIGPYNQIGDAFAQLAAIAGPAGLFERSEPPAMIAIYHDDPESTPAAELRAHAGLTIADGADAPDGLIAIDLPAGRYARTTHHGTYELLGDTWGRFLGGWLPASGHRLGAGGTFEQYRNTPMDVPIDELVTDLFAAID